MLTWMEALRHGNKTLGVKPWSFTSNMLNALIYARPLILVKIFRFYIKQIGFKNSG